MFDDEPAASKVAHVVGEDLTSMSIEELEMRIVDLKAEITRLQETASQKRTSMLSAEGFFKK